MKLRHAGSAWLAIFVLAGCVQMASHAEEPALLKAGDAAGQAALQAAIQRALGQPVTLAKDALVAKSELLIEPVPARVDGQRIDGRDLAVRVERFTLWRVGGQCVLRREGSGERLDLPGVNCMLAPKP